MYGRAQEANFQEKGGDHAKLAHACCEQATQAGALSWPLPDAFPAHVNCHIGPARAGLTVELQPLPCWKVKNQFARAAAKPPAFSFPLTECLQRAQHSQLFTLYDLCVCAPQVLASLVVGLRLARRAAWHSL